MDMAKLVSTWSKDPSTKVGSVIASGNKLYSHGYNGPPKGVPDDFWLENRQRKLSCTLHAEENAILNIGSKPTINADDPLTLYVTAMPCSNCSSRIVQFGIRRVVCDIGSPEFQERWKDSIELSKLLFEHAGVTLITTEEKQ